MKIRKGFVSNSSSSSFVLITTDKNEVIVEDGYKEMEECGRIDINIDTILNKLHMAKNAGATKITISHGGGYEG